MTSTPAPDQETMNLEAGKLLLSIARERLLGQEQGWNAHRTKAGFILAAVGASLTAVLSIVRTARPAPVVPLLALAVLGAGGMAIAAIWPRTMTPGVKLHSMFTDPVLLTNELKTVKHLLVHYDQAIQQNERTLDEVSRVTRIALGCLAAALAITILVGLTLA